MKFLLDVNASGAVAHWLMDHEHIGGDCHCIKSENSYPEVVTICDVFHVEQTFMDTV